MYHDNMDKNKTQDNMVHLEQDIVNIKHDF